MYKEIAIVLSVTVSNYVEQLQVCKLIISRFILRTQQEQLNNIFMSQPDGVLVYNIDDEDQTRTLGDEPDDGKGIQIQLHNDAFSKLTNIDFAENDLEMFNPSDKIFIIEEEKS